MEHFQEKHKSQSKIESIGDMKVKEQETFSLIFIVNIDIYWKLSSI